MLPLTVCRACIYNHVKRFAEERDSVLNASKRKCNLLTLMLDAKYFTGDCGPSGRLSNQGSSLKIFSISSHFSPGRASGSAC